MASTPNDYQRITSSITGWAEWRGAWELAAAVHEGLGREALRASRWRSAGTHLSQAAVYYHFAKFFWVHDVEEMRSTHARAVACFMDSLEHLSPPGKRVEIPFESGTIVGVLRLPPGEGPHPVVILVPGLDSAKEELRPTEQLFCDRRLATFVVDGPGQGEAEYDLPIRPDWEVPGAAIVDALTAIAEVDAGRIGIWGVSLGGYYAPRAASGEKRIRACISMSGPFTWEQLPQLTRDAFRVRSFSTTDAEAQRKALELSLEGRADRIAIPLQIVAGRLDRIIPSYHAELMANAVSGPVDMLMFEDGGHNCTNINYRHRLLSADWMAHQLQA
ncbi:MAG TPA: alpha/beta fold hydrolase [Acidimicrobiales bacterium]|nr:alpha/beta fold hydrolase [Acidimicrobiales bacterium]